MGGCSGKHIRIKIDDLRQTREEKLNSLALSNVVIEDYIKEAIQVHNSYRKLHGAPPLEHDPELSRYSQAHAFKMAEKDSFKNSDCRLGDKQIGENIATQWEGMLAAKNVTDMWYNEIQNYNFDNPGFVMDSGHFTQVVWSNTQYMGIGIAKSSKGNIYVVANYYPPGNVNGYFELNVFPRIKQK
jgi:uncharacterized protein YkwD